LAQFQGQLGVFFTLVAPSAAAETGCSGEQVLVVVPGQVSHFGTWWRVSAAASTKKICPPWR
jgi:hypothetical protein